MDTFLAELKDRFIDHRESILGIGACNPGSATFLDSNVIKPFATEYRLDFEKLCPQLTLAKTMLSASSVTVLSMVEAIKVLSQTSGAFDEVIKLMKIALTVPVASATAECSFSALKLVKSYLRSTMKED